QDTLCCLILDDGSILLESHRQQLFAINESLATVKGHPHIEINKVVIVEKIMAEEVVLYNKLLKTNLCPVKKIANEIEEKKNASPNEKNCLDKASAISKSFDPSIYQTSLKEDKVGKNELPINKNTDCDKLSKGQRTSQVVCHEYQSRPGNLLNMTIQDKNLETAVPEKYSDITVHISSKMPQVVNERKLDTCKKNVSSSFKTLNTEKLNNLSEQKKTEIDIEKSSSQTTTGVNFSGNSLEQTNSYPDRRISVVPISKVLSNLQHKNSQNKNDAYISSPNIRDSKMSSLKEFSNNPKKKYMHCPLKDSTIYSDQNVLIGDHKVIGITSQSKFEISKKQSFSLKEQNQAGFNLVPDTKSKKPLTRTFKEYVTLKTLNQAQRKSISAQIPNNSSQVEYPSKES
ncbi:unnamed protein product, partial [Meganyctiphanes norvegica]